MNKQELLNVFKNQIIKESKDVYGAPDTWIGGYEDGRVDALTFAYKRVKWLDEPEKPEIPKFVADWIEEKRPYYSLMTIVGNYLNGFGMPERVEEWITDNRDDFVKALVNGYTIEKEPVWVVLQDAQYFHAFTGEYDESEGFEYVLAMYEGHAHTFADKQKAEAVATLVDGTVKEWSE